MKSLVDLQYYLFPAVATGDTSAVSYTHLHLDPAAPTVVTTIVFGSHVLVCFRNTTCITNTPVTNWFSNCTRTEQLLARKAQADWTGCTQHSCCIPSPSCLAGARAHVHTYTWNFYSFYLLALVNGDRYTSARVCIFTCKILFSKTFRKKINSLLSVY